jgi:hypothetical protein
MISGLRYRAQYIAIKEKFLVLMGEGEWADRCERKGGNGSSDNGGKMHIV